MSAWFTLSFSPSSPGSEKNLIANGHEGGASQLNHSQISGVRDRESFSRGVAAGLAQDIARCDGIV
jgi:hypothetical protein